MSYCYTQSYCDVLYDEDNETQDDLGEFRIVIGGQRHICACLDPDNFLYLVDKLIDGISKLDSLKPEDLVQDKVVVWSVLIQEHDEDSDEYVLEVMIEEGEGRLYLRKRYFDGEEFIYSPIKARFVQEDQETMDAAFRKQLYEWYTYTKKNVAVHYSPPGQTEEESSEV